jgi:hypothetical protein
MTLNFRYLWLKSRQEKSYFETLHNFKVEEAADLISFGQVFLIDNLFLYFGHCACRQCISIPKGANFSLFSP